MARAFQHFSRGYQFGSAAIHQQQLLGSMPMAANYKENTENFEPVTYSNIFFLIFYSRSWQYHGCDAFDGRRGPASG